MRDTAVQVAWKCAGSPPPAELVSRAAGRAGVALEVASGPCACCAGEFERGYPVRKILNPTFSQHADYMRFGSHACPACAWFFLDAKAHHRSFLAFGDTFLWPVLGVASVEPGRPLWRDAIAILRDADPAEKAVALLTTDPKPRLWPRVALGTASRLRLYCHSGDDDVSFSLDIELKKLTHAIALAESALDLGFTKTCVKHGLLSDFKTAMKDSAASIRLEKELSALRSTPEFLPSVLMACSGKERAKLKGGQPKGLFDNADA